MALSFREKYSFGIGAFGNLWLYHLEKNILLV